MLHRAAHICATADRNLGEAPRFQLSSRINFPNREFTWLLNCCDISFGTLDNLPCAPGLSRVHAVEIWNRLEKLLLYDVRSLIFDPDLRNLNHTQASFSIHLWNVRSSVAASMPSPAFGSTAVYTTHCWRTKEAKVLVQDRYPSMLNTCIRPYGYQKRKRTTSKIWLETLHTWTHSGWVYLRAHRRWSDQNTWAYRVAGKVQFLVTLEKSGGHAVSGRGYESRMARRRNENVNKNSAALRLRLAFGDCKKIWHDWH